MGRVSDFFKKLFKIGGNKQQPQMLDEGGKNSIEGNKPVEEPKSEFSDLKSDMDEINRLIAYGKEREAEERAGMEELKKATDRINNIFDELYNPESQRRDIMETNERFNEMLERREMRKREWKGQSLEYQIEGVPSANVSQDGSEQDGNVPSPDVGYGYDDDDDEEQYNY